MTTATYLGHAAAWLLIGFVAGVLLMLRIARGQTPEVPAVPDTQPADVKPSPRRAWIRRHPRRPLDIFLVVMIIASAVQGVVFYQRTSELVVKYGALVECQRAYQTAFADALDARSSASTEAQKALDELMRKVGALTGGVPSQESRKQFTDALATYLQKRDESTKQQQLNPYPPSPRDLCR